MKFTTRRDVDLPADVLFERTADFDQMERMLIRRGTRVRRADPATGSPMGWEIEFDWHGRRRTVALAVTRYDRPEGMALRGRSEQFDIEIDGAVVALARRRSRLLLTIDVKPRTLRSRLMLQGVKLQKAKLDRTLADRFSDYVSAAIRTA